MNALQPGIISLVAILGLLSATCKGPMEADVIKISGVITDLQGGRYPEVAVILTIPGGEMKTSTNASGEYSFKLVSGGASKITIIPPLSMVIEGEKEQMIELQSGDEITVDFQLSYLSPPYSLVLDVNDIFEEVKNVNGNLRVADSELVFARNAFDPPIGLLTPIIHPDSIQLRLGEWKQANGSLAVSCSGNESTIVLSLKGMIPKGTYSIWCNFLNKQKYPGESINFNLDVEEILPLGSGSGNVVKADEKGDILSSITHPSCLLTESVGLVIVVDYHLNGRTFGAAHIPDEEDVNHLLFYFE